jgi:hypothetical protein|tara:strand:- start:108 stop:401 length:294 start_codon:yes stop_codon:yes gene_type:complete
LAKEIGNSNLINFKLRIEQVGLFISLTGLVSILQPFTLLLYTYGFYILVIGAITYFLGSIIPEEENTGKAIIKAVSILGFSILVLLLTIFLSPLLIV